MRLKKIKCYKIISGEKIMADFNNFLVDVEKGIASLIENSFNEFRNQAIAAGKEFIEDSKDDIKVWTEQLADGQLSKEDFEWLMRSKETSAKLIILKHIGLTKAQVDKLTTGIIDVVNTSAFKYFV